MRDSPGNLSSCCKIYAKIANMEFEMRSPVDFHSTKSSNTTKASKVTRKKFAVPPVKVACLEW
jgi:hypothetical protein